MIREFTRRIYGSVRVLGMLPDQRRVARIPREAIVRKTDHRIRAAVRYAADTVPYYREMFRAQRIDPQRVCTAADLDQLPIIEKSMVRKAPDLFLSHSATGRRSIAFTTSGTTGEPLTIYHDPGSIVANIAYCEAEKQVAEEILGRRKGVRQLSIIYSTSTLRKIWEIYRKLTFISPPSEQSLSSIESPLDDIITRINRFKPDVLSGYGSHLETLFRYAMVKGITMHLPELVNYGADAMTDVGRKMIQEYYGIPVISRYGAVESFRIGFTCREGAGFHIRSDLCHLRIVDEDDRNLPAGKAGQIIISNLVNRGSVLLNYRLGDIGTLSKTLCPCGRSLPLLTGLDGRVEDILILKKGQIVHPRVIWSVIKKYPEVMRYQLIQHERDRFKLRLVTADRADFDRVSADIIRNLESRLADSTVEGVYTDQIDTPTEGKFRPVISLCDHEGGN